METKNTNILRLINIWFAELRYTEQNSFTSGDNEQTNSVYTNNAKVFRSSVETRYFELEGETKS